MINEKMKSQQKSFFKSKKEIMRRTVIFFLILAMNLNYLSFFALAADVSESSSTPTEQADSGGLDAISTEEVITKSDSTLSASTESRSVATLSTTEEGSEQYGEGRKPIENRLHIDTESTSGALVYQYPINVPPGRNGMQPDLKLSYNSQAQELNSQFGAGWSINIPYIERINREGVEDLYSRNYFYSSLSGELKEVSGGQSMSQQSNLSMPLLSAQKISDIGKTVAPEASSLLKSLNLSADEVDIESDGSIKLKNPKELKEKRTKNSQSELVGYTQDGREEINAKFYGGDLNYFDKETGEYEKIDTTLVDSPEGWSMDKANYQAQIASSVDADHLITFKNKDQELYLSLFGVKKKIVGVKNVSDKVQSNRKITYKNAIGNDIDLEVSTDNESIRKEVVINSLKSLGKISGQEYYEIPFKLTANKNIDIKTPDGTLLSKERIITSNQMMEIIDQDGTSSYIWGPVAESSANSEGIEDRVGIEIRYELKDDGIYLTKLIPVKWLSTAIFPVRTDAVLSYFSGAGDGSVARESTGSFSSVRGGSGTYANPSVVNDYVRITSAFSGNNWVSIYRLVLPFDTSSLPDDVAITSATIRLIKRNYTNYYNSYLVLTDSGASSPESLTPSDYNIANWTTNEYSDRAALSSNAYFSINQSGLSIINPMGYSEFGVRISQDFDNSAPTWASMKSSYFQTYLSEQTGTDVDPYLSVTYSARPSSPSNLLVENDTTGSINVIDQNPEFSAIYNDLDAGDYATHYQIQVSSSSTNWSTLVWDSSKTALSANLAQGQRCPDISYGGTPLVLDGSTYYWRIKFWDNGGAEGLWSSGNDYFQMLTASDLLFGAKIEGNNQLKYEFINNSTWKVTDKNGLVYRFGEATTTRQFVPGSYYKINKWLLQEVDDLNGNKIKYEYYSDNGQSYPSRILYTGDNSSDGIFEVVFTRESRNDDVSNYATGYKIETDYRINEIQIKQNGTWVKKYQLYYNVGDNGTKSLLDYVVESGRDEQSNVVVLPQSKFYYQTKGKSWTENTNYNIPVDFVDSQGNDPGVRMADVNGDGLVDLLYGHANFPSDRRVYLNEGDGTGWVETSWTIPVGFTDNYSDAGVRVMDVNGDGYADFVRSYNTSRQVFINTKQGGWSLDTNYTVPISFYDGYPVSPIKIADVNGDGLPDILYSLADANSVYKAVYINNGNGTGWTVDNNYYIPENFVIFSSSLGNLDQGVVLDDVNGDGLVDIIKSKYGQERLVYLNKGDSTGWASDIGFVPPVDFTSDYDMGVRQADINSDGLLDLIQGRNCNGYAYHVWLNSGSSWVEKTGWSMPTYFSECSADNGVRIVDVDGDNLLDMVKARGNASILDRHVYLANAKKADLLSEIDHSKGAITKINYKGTPQYLDGSNNLLNPKLPFAMPVLDSLVINDGRGNIATSTYQYFDGEYYFANPFDRRLAGFGKVAKTDGEGNVTKTYYHQGNTSDSTHGEYNDNQAKIGQVYRTEIYDGANNLYAKTINKWDSYDLGDERNFVKMIQSVDSSYDGTANHKDKATSFVYDNANGNLLQKTFYGEVTGSDDGTFTDTGTDLSTNTIEYASNATLNIIGLPKHELSVDQSSNKVKETNYYYDNLSYGNVNIGNQTKVENWVTGTSYINTTKTYNSYGLVTQETDPRGKATNYVYDSYNLYPVTVTNPLSQATNYTYDYSSGQVKTMTDPNSRVFEKVYDGLDRVIQEKQPDIDSPSTSVVKTAYTYYDNILPRCVKQINNLDATNSVENYSYLDGLERKVQDRNEAETTNTFSIKDYSYNKNGLLKTESLPYFGTGTTTSVATTSQNMLTRYLYDSLQRVISMANSVGTTTSAYNNWKTTITDANNNAKDLYKDAYDNLIRVDEHNDSNTYATLYSFNLLGKLTKIQDALNNERNFTYDGLGRLLTSQDLHANGDSSFGVLTYTYDNAGNILTKVDPNNNTVNYTYDDINRNLTEDNAGTTGTEVTNVYDTCTNGIGHLCSATTVNSSTAYTYNALGQVSVETKTINSVAYPTSYNYNRQSQQALITYPDNSQVRNNYNTAGQLEKIEQKENGGSFSDVVSNYDYNPMGQIITENFANGVNTTNTYDTTKLYRLTNKLTNKTNNLQDLSYIYDNVGNITKIIDNSVTNAKKTTDYTYDDLYRLTIASTTNAINGQNYRQTFSYNAIGNIMNKSDQGDYVYSGTGYTNPQAVTQIASSTYAYDNNGNLTNDSTWSHSWDYDNKLASSTNGIITVNYQYDQDGNRISKTTGTSTNYYINQFYELDNGIPVKHIFAGDNKVATVKATTTPITTYTSTDHLTGTSVETDSTGSPIEVIDYYPFGSVRIDEKTSSQENHYKYTGKELDSETNLYYYGARYYNSDIGRFVGVDPVYLAVGNEALLKEKTGLTQFGYLKNPQNLNSYSYVINNPLKHIDRNGEWLDTVIDIGFIAYDVVKLAQAVMFGGDVSTELTALGLDMGGAALPLTTGLGMTARAGKALNKAGDAVNVINKVENITATAGNYRSVFQKTYGILKSSDIQVHHSLPQKYESMFQHLGVNIHDPKYLRSVDSQTHTKITNEWTQFQKSNPNADASVVQNFAEQIDKKYGSSFNQASHFADN